MDSNYLEFLNKKLKLSEKRNHRIKNSLGFFFFYRYYTKNKPKDSRYVLDEAKYALIINEMNKGVADALIENRTIKLPCGAGVFNIVKRKNHSWFSDDGKLLTTKKVDMVSTLKLWYEDEEAMLNKTLVRYDEEYMYRIVYNTHASRFKNKAYFHFSFNREIKRKLKNIVKSLGYDTYEQV